MADHRVNSANREALGRFWRRRPFHDECVEDVSALNTRVLVRLREYTLVVTGVTNLKPCELPAIWLDASVVEQGGKIVVHVETDSGHLAIIGTDLRLIRNVDLAVLIPPVDAWFGR